MASLCELEAVVPADRAEVAGGFVGCCIGMYAVAEKAADGAAVFTKLSYEA